MHASPSSLLHASPRLLLHASPRLQLHTSPRLRLRTSPRLLQVQGDKLLVANAGDSRCVVSEAGKAVPMSFDHKPTDEEEHSRIIKVNILFAPPPLSPAPQTLCWAAGRALLVCRPLPHQACETMTGAAERP